MSDEGLRKGRGARDKQIEWERVRRKKIGSLILDIDRESAFTPYVGFGVLMISKLGTNEILMRYIVALVP